MSAAIIVPVKREGHKSRLGGVLSAQEGAELARLFLLDLLEVISGCGLLGSTYVVSPSPKMLAVAESAGANTVGEPADRGVNQAVRDGAAAAAADDLLVVPTDLPLLTEGDLLRSFELRAGGFTVIAPSREFNGTNLFFFGRETLDRLSYDSDSFWSHVSSVSAARGRLAVLTSGGVMEDVDTPEDATRVLGAGINRPSLDFLRRKVTGRRTY
jgi:2-phospho-L-lactate/phosphoenolpyruvate guanylyltransferase